MTHDEQRIAIAELCGWRRGPVTVLGNWVSPDNRHDYPPDYLSDLNACHEFEKTLTGEQWLTYCDNLSLICQGTSSPTSVGKLTVHATAAQRCEAFLRTLGKWSEKA